ncbi:hypothetical protein [Campylobacter troglodytis]|nr:hypothetical protein [Campylobacter troglodytis]
MPKAISRSKYCTFDLNLTENSGFCVNFLNESRQAEKRKDKK